MATKLKTTHQSAGNEHEVFILGDSGLASAVKKSLDTLPDLLFKPVGELTVNRASPHLIISVCDFSSVSNMQIVARAFHRYDAACAHKIVYSADKTNLDQQHLLFAIELGARFTAYGPNRDYKLKEYIKRTVVIPGADTSYSHIEAEIESFRIKGDDEALKTIADQLVRLPKNNETVLRLQAIVSQSLRLMSKSVYYLRKILSINPQNLWAANELGRLFLRSNRIAEGVEILEKLSQFHDLNSERMLHLGGAYLGANKLEAAEKVYDKGHQLVGLESEDNRFREGLAKVKVAQGDVHSALSILGRSVLSEEVLGFLNMRAVMAIRNEQIEDGIRFYQLALDGCLEDKLVRSKLLFNMGLAYIKLGDEERAVSVLEDSVKLGGKSFDRAKKSLTRAKNLLKQKKTSKEKPNPSGDLNNLEEIDLDDIS